MNTVPENTSRELWRNLFQVYHQYHVLITLNGAGHILLYEDFTMLKLGLGLPRPRVFIDTVRMEL